MKDIAVEGYDENDKLEYECPFCGTILDEYGNHCRHVLCGKGSLYQFNIINPKIKEILNKVKRSDDEFEDDFTIYSDYLEENEKKFPEVIRLSMYFLFSDEVREEHSDSWIGEMMEGPQDICIFYLMPNI